MKQHTWIIYSCIYIFTVLQQCHSVTVNTGQRAILECPLAGNYTFPVWAGPSSIATPLTSDGGVVNDDNVQYSDDINLKITLATSNYTGNYTCNNGTDEGTVVLEVNPIDADIDILGRSGTLYKNITVTCIVRGSYVKPNVFFSFPNVENPPNITDLETNTTLLDDDTYEVNLTSMFEAIQSIENRFISCTAVFKVLDLETTSSNLQYLDLKVEPLVYSFQHSPADENVAVNYTCVTATRPRSSFSWTIDGVPIGDAPYTYQEHTSNEMQPENLRWLGTGTLTLTNLTRADNQKAIECDIIYEGVEFSNIGANISVYFEPTNISLSGNSLVLLDDDGEATLTLTCSSDEANPTTRFYYRTSENAPSTITGWGDSLTSNYTRIETPGKYHTNSSSQDIDVVIDASMHGHFIQCCTGIFYQTSQCDAVEIDVASPPVIIEPRLTNYYAYVGDVVRIACTVTSNPVANIEWRFGTGSGAARPAQVDNYLSLEDVTTADVNTYVCYSWLDIQGENKAVSKAIQLVVLAKPGVPSFSIGTDGSSEYFVSFVTADPASAPPRDFYLQYRQEDTNIFFEVAEPLPAHGEYRFPDHMLKADTVYEIRIKCVDAYGLTLYTPLEKLSVTDTVQSKDDHVYWRNTILVSVFGTAAFFIIIILIMVCCMKNGKCARSSSSKSYAM